MSRQRMPHVPDDIARLIFEQAALDDQKTALNLVLVARRVQHWYVPGIFFFDFEPSFIHQLENRI